MYVLTVPRLLQPIISKYFTPITCPFQYFPSISTAFLLLPYLKCCVLSSFQNSTEIITEMAWTYAYSPQLHTVVRLCVCQCPSWVTYRYTKLLSDIIVIVVHTFLNSTIHCYTNIINYNDFLRNNRCWFEHKSEEKYVQFNYLVVSWI